jgi:hypothetical protein
MWAVGLGLVAVPARRKFEKAFRCYPITPKESKMPSSSSVSSRG